MKDVACHCGDSTFTLRLSTLEQVGVLTCSHEHHSLLLDSRDYWDDVIDYEKPREFRCKCKSKTFKLALSYTLRTNSPDVSQVDVIAKCLNCGVRHTALTIDIDYGPTHQLIDRPLDPCDNPWARTRKVEYSALWEHEDLEDYIRHVMDRDRRAFLVALGSTYPSLDQTELLYLLRDTPAWDLYLPVGEINYPSEKVLQWKEQPVVHVWGPKVMSDKTGLSATMYFIEYAEEVMSDAGIIRQPDEFLTFARSMTNWLKETYSSERGKDSFDNPALFEKFREWW